MHAELVAFVRCSDGRVLRWTGKSYPTTRQEARLIQVTDLDSHCVRFDGDRVLILGCHDLNMFSPRAWANQNSQGERRKRCRQMRGVVSRFEPTVILQHPHGTDSALTWQLPWAALRERCKETLKAWASGICFQSSGEDENGNLKRERDELQKVLAKTRRYDAPNLDFVFSTRKGQIEGPAPLVQLDPFRNTPRLRK